MFKRWSRSLRNNPLGRVLRLTLIFTGIYFFFVVCGGLYATPGQILIDILIGLMGWFFWMCFFAQFVLPVRTAVERLQAVSRLLSYQMRNHGPAVFIRNGQIDQSEGEMNRRGPGVAFLDTASGAYLRVLGRFTRAAGPGVVFLNNGESVGGAVDLHLRSRKLGPRGQEDPFAPAGANELPQAYEERQKRRRETQALTRDNLEVVPDLVVNFRIDARPGDGNTHFGYHAEAVRRAVGGRFVDLDRPEDAERLSEWDLLPARLAADLWREYLAKFLADDLFRAVYPNTKDNRTGLEVIQDMLTLRLTRAVVNELDEFGRPTGNRKVSDEFAHLNQRGLKVMGVQILNLRLPATLEDQLARDWKSSWWVKAKKEQEQAEIKRSNAVEEGRREALAQFAEASTILLVGDEHPEWSGDKILLNMIAGINTRLRSEDPTWKPVGQGVKDSVRQLNELAAWIEQGAEE